jgi:formiminotetrahydrofolate cyclodeaminase
VSLKQLVEQIARRGSWFGGGSVAALSAALAAALLEKLTAPAQDRRRVRAIRQSCLALIERDAIVFSRVIQATRTSRPRLLAQRLKMAIQIPCQVVRHARAIQDACRTAQRWIKPQFRSDLRCAMALAHAADMSGLALIDTNLAWLKDAAYAKRIRQQLRSAPRRHER